MSSNDLVICVKDLSKYFHIYDAPMDRLKQMVVPRLQKLLGNEPKQYFREFSALKDVCFEIRKGETVGIIGRNGSGKSTLLQIICGTLASTKGEVKASGRIAALLELGSGFNPEFTGRENVYLNASLLGLTNKEINNKFNEIIAFADIGEFIDLPVKTYSSGMMVRLAFAVIAHVDADILVIDEALAVGDAIFTQKCMEYIREFQSRGTLLFVSHDISAVQNLCKTAIWLEGGNVRMIGQAKDVAESYLHYTLQETYGDDAKLDVIKNDKKNKVAENNTGEIIAAMELDYEGKLTARENLLDADGWKTGAADLIFIKIQGLDGSVQEVFLGGEKVQVVIQAKANQELEFPIIGFTVRDRLGQELFGENTLPYTEHNPVSVRKGQSLSAKFVFQLPMLPNGEYAVMASVANGNLYDHIQHHFLHNALILTVASSKIRWGLVGIPFDEVALKVFNEK